MGRIEDLGLVADKGLEWKAKCEALTAERDQLRVLYDTARDGMRQIGGDLEDSRAEVERLRGEVEAAKKREGLLQWAVDAHSRNLLEHSDALTDATARAEAAERDFRALDALAGEKLGAAERERDEAQAQVQELKNKLNRL